MRQPPLTSTAARRAAYTTALLVFAAVAAASLLACGDSHGASSVGAATVSRAEREQEAAAERRLRHADETRLELAIADDARLLASTGALKGPILRATCTSFGSGSSTNLSSFEGRYDCLAVSHDHHVPHHGHIVEGVRFFATIDFRSHTYTFGGG